MALRRGGIADDADDVIARLVEAGLLHEALVAELFAVVGGHDDERVVPSARVAQVGPHPAELGVDLADHAEVLRLELGHRLRIRAARPLSATPRSTVWSGCGEAGIGSGGGQSAGSYIVANGPAALYGGCGRRYEAWANHGSSCRSIHDSSASVRNVDTECSAGRVLSVRSAGVGGVDVVVVAEARAAIPTTGDGRR